MISQILEAERFGTITVAGIPTLLITGDFDATVIDRNAANSTTLAAVNAWPTSPARSPAPGICRSSVGSVASQKTSQWNLGVVPGANTNSSLANPLSNVTSLSLGVVSQTNIEASGNVAALSAASWNTKATFTGNTVNGSAVVTNVSSVADLFVGQAVSGAGIPGGTTILAITPSTITLSANATATGVDVNLSVVPANASDTIQAKSFGTVATTGLTSVGDVGDMVNVNLIATGNNAGSASLTATGNKAGNALTTLSVAGNFDATLNNLTNIVVNNGNIGSINAGRTVGLTARVNITAETSPNAAATSGAITTVQAAQWLASSTLDAKSVVTMNITGSSIVRGNFLGNVILQGMAGSTAGTLGTFQVADNVQTTSNVTVYNGGVGSFTVGVSIQTLNLQVLGGAGGSIGTLTAAEWNTGGSLIALSIGTLTMTGLPLPNRAAAFIAGNLTNVPMTFFTGTGLAAGTISVAGTLAITSFIRADNGIGTLTVGRDVAGGANSIIHTDSASPTTNSVGRINVLTAGRWGANNGALPVAISANSLGAVTIKGYTAPDLGSDDFIPGDFDGSTVYVRGKSIVSGVGIDSFVVNGNMIGSMVDVANGITTITVGRQVAGSFFRAENPVAASSGKIGSLSAGEIVGASIQANSVGTLKTTANLALFPYLGLQGNFNTSDVTTTALTGTALGTFSVAGNMAASTMNVGGSVTTFAVAQILSSPLANGSRVAGNSIAAGFNSTSTLGTLSAANISGLDLVTNSLTTLAVNGNATAGLAGAIANSLFTVIGNVGTVGIGTATVTGTVAGTDFDVFNGNVTNVTVGAFTSSDLWVGFHAVAANDIHTPLALGAGTWNTTNYLLSTFKTTGPVVSGTTPLSAGTFTDSLVVAGKLGTITLPGIDTTIPVGSPTFTFGLGFRASGAAKGTVTIAGGLRDPGFRLQATDPDFFYLGLLG